MKSTPLQAITPELAAPVTICVLLFGEHFELCKRFFSRLLRHTRPELFELRIGMNAVGSQTRDYIAEFILKKNSIVYHSDLNLYKGPMMRRMFHQAPIQTRWTVWFDDDSYPTRNDWLQSLGMAMEAFPETDMFGRHLFIRPDKRLMAFLRQSQWFRGMQFQIDSLKGDPKIDFIAGGFWALRTRWIYELDWPNPRIAYFDEDSILGEALRQNGAKIHNFTSGVEVNAAARRCGPETPTNY